MVRCYGAWRSIPPRGKSPDGGGCCGENWKEHGAAATVARRRSLGEEEGRREKREGARGCEVGPARPSLVINSLSPQKKNSDNRPIDKGPNSTWTPAQSLLLAKHSTLRFPPAIPPPHSRLVVLFPFFFSAASHPCAQQKPCRESPTRNPNPEEPTKCVSGGHG